MSFTRETAKSSVQQAIYEFLKWAVGAAWLAYGPRMLSAIGQRRFGLTGGTALAWGIVLALVRPFIGLFLVDWWRADRVRTSVLEHGPSAASRLRLLERFYITLASLKLHASQLKAVQGVGGNYHTMGFIDLGIAVEHLRNELIDLSPSVFPNSVALEFKQQGMPHPDRPIDGLSDNWVPKKIDELMDKVHHQWSRYAEECGIAPLKFREKPLVKLTP